MRQLAKASFLLVLLSSGGCSSSKEETEKKVIFFVAASTQEAVRDLAEVLGPRRGVAVQVSMGDSSQLALQIARGAPADLFLSAAPKWVDFLDKQGLVAARSALLSNRLVLVVPGGNPAHLHRLEDLASPRLRRLAVAGPTVPAGIYARQALRHLKLWELLEKRGCLLSGENVRVVLAYVARGEAEAGVVYATDVSQAPGVEIVATFPPESHEPIRYVLARVRRPGQPTAAQRLYEDFHSPEAAAVFRRYGFVWLPKEAP